MGGQSERTQGQAKMSMWNSFSYICTRALHSFRYFLYFHAASTVIPLLPKATFTPSIQPNLGLPHTRPPLTSAINTFWPFGFHPLFPNDQTILILSDLLYLPFYTSSPTHLFIHNSTHSWHSNQISQKHSLSFSQHFTYPMPCSVLCRWHNYSFI